jgi:WNK lysine deficient protein kinase
MVYNCLKNTNIQIEEQVLPSRYQNLITGEINRILRDMKSIKRDENLKMKLDGSDSNRRLNTESQTILKPGSTMEELSRKISTNAGEDLDFLPLKGIVYTMQLILDYNDDDSIEIIVNDTAIATKRGAEKATEWLNKLHKQDIMTVGDLRDLQEDDWGNLGLTVFANRALRNSLYGKPTRSTKGPIRMPSTSSLPHI